MNTRSNKPCKAALIHTTGVKQVSVLLILGIAMASCGPASVSFTFDNRTDAVLCAYPHPDDAATARCLVEVQPQSKGHSGRDCDDRNDRRVRVLLVVKDSRSVIYDRTASCGEWNGHGTVVIQQDGPALTVTDQLEVP
jgi:hypothetical protein